MGKPCRYRRVTASVDNLLGKVIVARIHVLRSVVSVGTPRPIVDDYLVAETHYLTHESTRPDGEGVRQLVHHTAMRGPPKVQEVGVRHGTSLLHVEDFARFKAAEELNLAAKLALPGDTAAVGIVLLHAL